MTNHRTDALTQALQMETEGMAFYKAARDKATSRFGQRIFEYLRSSEEDHINRIRAIFRSLENENEWPEPAGEPESRVSELKTIFTDALTELKTRESIDSDDLDALKQAADFERRGEYLYQQRAGEASDPFERAFYSQLAFEETQHLKSILDSIQMLEDPQGFFAQHEPGIMAGI